MALSADKDMIQTEPGTRAHGMAASVTIYHGALVSVDTSGYARPARTSTTDRCIGFNWVAKKVNGTTAGATKVEIRYDRVLRCKNSSAGDLIAQKDVGADCYVVDDETVALTNGTNTRIRAGKIDHVAADGTVGVRFDQ